MSDPTVPANVKLAAKRGFIRTTAQGYAATVTSALGVSATAIVALGGDRTAWAIAGVSAGLAIITPPLAGLASYLSIIARGIPADYTDGPA